MAGDAEQRPRATRRSRRSPMRSTRSVPRSHCNARLGPPERSAHPDRHGYGRARHRRRRRPRPDRESRRVIRDLASAGEILLSASTASVVRVAPPTDVQLLALGSNQLRGIDESDDTRCCSRRGRHGTTRSGPQPYPGLVFVLALRTPTCSSGEKTSWRAVSELLRAHGFVAIVGASGSGKSSVALAGVAPNIGDAIVVRPGVSAVIWSILSAAATIVTPRRRTLGSERLPRRAQADQRRVLSRGRPEFGPFVSRDITPWEDG